MSDAPPPPLPPIDPTAPPEARVRGRRPFHFVWLVPIVAAVIAGFLGYRALIDQGPTIKLTFATAEGLVAGQTKIRHKAVELGIVKTITLSKDMSHVEVRADMQRQAERFLASSARFWVVRPRLNAGNISGLETLLSGAYIEMDPGISRGPRQVAFTGLEEPPAVRSDEPGKAFQLKADRIGSLSSGSPVFFHDIVVGEVLGYDVHPAEAAANASIIVHLFVRAPFDTFVHSGTKFWNASGISVDLGAQGVQLRLESLQAVLSGGIAFVTPPDASAGPPVAPDTVFTLYKDAASAASAGFSRRIPFMVYFEGSVRGLAVGAPVELFGIEIGNVTAIDLEFDPQIGKSRVAVRLEIQPERVLKPDALHGTDPMEVARRMTARGIRAQLRSANLLTGQLYVAFDVFPDALVLPSLPGGLEGITTSAGEILRKIDALPLADIGRNLDQALRGASDITNGPELKQSLRALNETLNELQDLVRKADAGAGPALKRLPEIAQGLQTVVDRAGKLVGSADVGYGENSEFRRDVQRLLEQVSDTARSVRLLADYLDQHPDALLRGRSGRIGER
jgi:paraquat-inducible protein B